MKIGFASNDRSPRSGWNVGGSGWYRVELIAKTLGANGYEVVSGMAIGSARTGVFAVLPPQFADAPIEEKRERALVPDVIVLSRYMLAEAADQIRHARAAGQVVINDVDDYFDGMSPTNAAFRAVDPRRNPASNVVHYREALSAGNLITCSTPFLADRMRRYGPTHVVRNAIDVDRWCGHRNAEPPRLGWTGATSHRSGDVEVIAPAMRHVLGKGFAPQFVHLGANDQSAKVHRLLRLGPDSVVEYPQLPIDTWPSGYRHIDVGVVPLSQHPFNEAKSCIKGMEYAAAGIPFVASPLPEYRWLHATHGIGLLASTPKDWVRALRRLIDPDERAAIAVENRLALDDLSIERRWHEWAVIYEAGGALCR